MGPWIWRVPYYRDTGENRLRASLEKALGRLETGLDPTTGQACSASWHDPRSVDAWTHLLTKWSCIDVFNLLALSSLCGCLRTMAGITSSRCHELVWHTDGLLLAKVTTLALGDQVLAHRRCIFPEVSEVEVEPQATGDRESLDTMHF